MEEELTISRREFLKRFAVISIASAGGVGCLCLPVVEYGPPPEPEYGPPPNVEYGPPPVPEYGPPPVPDCVVDRMAYSKRDEDEEPLYGSTDVPTDAQFTIYFSNPMDESSQDAVSLSRAGGQVVGLGERLWVREDALKVAPADELKPATEYVLEVGQGAENVHGEPLQLTDSARAEFATATS
jgi:hypothetical protein